MPKPLPSMVRVAAAALRLPAAPQYVGTFHKVVQLAVDRGTPQCTDVLVAEFAQQRHMLRFEPKEDKFVSTRCDDGEQVRGARVVRVST